tara:strand:- start:41404 stop:41655 length:252 start_codon:yes stop_codon:yes gene_type:complete
MTINGIHPSELVEHRLRQERADRNKRVSDLKNNTEKLTFANALSDKQQGEIAQKNRARIDALEMKRLLTADDVSELTQMIKDL